jgi:hypothetical protein
VKKKVSENWCRPEKQVSKKEGCRPRKMREKGVAPEK